MIKRIAMGAGLSLALLGGVATATPIGGAMTATPVAAHPSLAVLSTAPLTVGADVIAVCATDASGNQTGDCQNSQATAGPADSAGVGQEGEATTPETDTAQVQSGDQSGAD